MESCEHGVAKLEDCLRCELAKVTRERDAAKLALGVARSRNRKFDPLAPDHPLIGQPCAACRATFFAGDETCLIPLGPGADPESQRAAREGRPYNAIATAVHWTCAGGSPDN